jgi:ribonuclease HII
MLKNYAREKNLKYVAGVDEVGWGAFAGPVVTAAVILPPDFESELIVDSKLICKSKKKMQTVYDLIMENAIEVSCTAVQAEQINELGPQPALDLCIKNSIEGLTKELDWLLMDGNRYNPHRTDLPYSLVAKGDNTYLSIAAAAIVAKYRRDEYMVKVHNLKPEFSHYGFNTSKGYGSPKMYAGLMEHGRTQYHRKKYVDSWQSKKGIIV